MVEDPKFGTDGVRGVANRDLTAHFAFRLGRVAGPVLAGGAGGRVVIGRDTRRSGDMLLAALSAGLMSSGVDVMDLGVIPTPGVAHLTKHTASSAGAVISASHNPAQDNGIKFFGPDGRKIADELETEMEQRLAGHEGEASPIGDGVGRLISGVDCVDEYVRFLCDTAPVSLAGLRIVADAGHGAASDLGPRVLRRLGAEVIAMHCEPDGMNINRGCGALHPDEMWSAVVRHGADLGVSFDGDADRAIFADETGELVDGDRVLAMCALAWRNTERLPGNVVVGTVMSNVGLERGLADAGVRLLRAPVGDRHVAEAMSREGASLGGEKSGHILFSQCHTTGDGILTAIQVAGLAKAAGVCLSELAGQIREYPQLLVNVPVWRRRGWRVQPQLWEAVRAAESRLGSSGRVLVRASGTERLIRVMAEGSDEETVRDIVHSIADVIRDTMGSAPAGDASAPEAADAVA